MRSLSVQESGLPGSPLPGAIPRRASVEGRLLYAIGDIHGCYDELMSLLDLVTKDAEARRNGRQPVLIFCGDYIDRGPNSAKVLDALCWLHRFCPYDLYLLKGNHEEVFQEYMRDPSNVTGWLKFGGRETMTSYGVVPPEIDAPLDEHYRARDDMLEVMTISHWKLLETLKSAVTIGDYAFVHAGVRASIPLDQQSEQDLLWIRQGFVDHEGPQEKVIVHGHTWHSDSPDLQEYRIGIDTGAYETGVLTAIRIEDGEIEFLRSR